jgi:3-oxoacyl-[acyl-carrier protein] reductase
MKLKGKTIVISGGGRGIGAAIGFAVAREGANIALCSRKINDVRKTAEAIEGETGNQTLATVVDVRDFNQIQRFAQEVLDRFGSVDVVVNNAGGWLGGELIAVDVGELIRIVETNILGTLLMTKAFLPGMYELNQGHVVNVASLSAIQTGYPDTALYVTCKRAIDGFGYALNREVRPHGIKVTTIYPNSVASSLDYEPSPETLRSEKGYLKLSLRDVAESVVFAITQSIESVVEQIVITSATRKDL